MRFASLSLRAFGLFVAVSSVLMPNTADAMTLVQVAELFNIFVGLVLTMSILIYFGGLGMYFSRLGTWPNNRDVAIKIMEWGVAVLFVLIVILTVVQYFQRYPRIASLVVGGIILLSLVAVALYVAAHSGAKKKEE